MKKHTQIYFKELSYTGAEFIPSEISGQKAVDIHHIDCRGIGGSDEHDNIENLMALTRKEHDILGDKKDYIEMLYVVHLCFLRDSGINFDIKKIPLKYFDNVNLVFGNRTLENKFKETLLNITIC